jgi:hypothetical protein
MQIDIQGAAPMLPLSPELGFIVGQTLFIVLAFSIVTFVTVSIRRHMIRQYSQLKDHNDSLLEQLHRLQQNFEILRVGFTEIHVQLQQRHSPPAASANPPTYPIAIRLARSGASPEEIMQSCGITRREAELLKRLHGALNS